MAVYSVEHYVAVHNLCYLQQAVLHLSNLSNVTVCVVQLEERSMTTQNVVAVLRVCRRIILEDAPFLMRRTPDNPVWRLHPDLWQHPAWEGYMNKVFEVHEEVCMQRQLAALALQQRF
jgi:hypothetical protein